MCCRSDLRVVHDRCVSGGWGRLLLPVQHAASVCAFVATSTSHLYRLGKSRVLRVLPPAHQWDDIRSPIRPPGKEVWRSERCRSIHSDRYPMFLNAVRCWWRLHRKRYQSIRSFDANFSGGQPLRRGLYVDVKSLGELKCRDQLPDNALP